MHRRPSKLYGCFIPTGDLVEHSFVVRVKEKKLLRTSRLKVKKNGCSDTFFISGTRQAVALPNKAQVILEAIQVLKVF